MLRVKRIDEGMNQLTSEGFWEQEEVTRSCL